MTRNKIEFKNLKANNFILNLNMKPMSRLGLNTLNFHVYNEQDRLIGYYRPTTGLFEPIADWSKCFSNGLIDKINERDEA